LINPVFKEITPLVKSLSSISPGASENWKERYGDYISDKYL
jgi:hypothetical protein